MIMIEALTLEEAYTNAATSLKCSVSELTVKVVQNPTNGFLGLFKKSAIIVATLKEEAPKQESKKIDTPEESLPRSSVENKQESKKDKQTLLKDTTTSESFVNDQDDEDDEIGSGLEYTADYDDAYDERDEAHEDEEEQSQAPSQMIQRIAQSVDAEINELFDFACFNIEKIEVSAYDDETLLIEFRGDDAALLIGKEGYRYKALSYMIFNWINAKYSVQLRLEIAEFLKNQEESVARYLTNVCENVERDGRAQTKILDGVLVQIALKELRERYPQKYVVIRSTKDGLKYIIINDYHSN